MEASDVWRCGLPPGQVEVLRAGGKQGRYAAGELIFEPAAHPACVYLLERGLVRIYRLSEMGEEATFGYVHQGEVFGECAAYIDSPRESFAQAVEDSIAWQIPRLVFQRVLSQRPDLALAVTRQIEKRLKHIESRVEGFVFRGVRSRLAGVLRELCEDFQPRPKPPIELPLTQAELATLVGCTRQSINLGLQQLEQSGLIQVRRGRVVVLRPEALRLPTRQEDRESATRFA